MAVYNGGSGNDVLTGADGVALTLLAATPGAATFDTQFSPDGTKVLFSTSTALVPGAASPDGGTQVYIKDLNSGVVTLVSKSASGVAGNGTSREAIFSPDGAKVAFYTQAHNLAASGDTFNQIVVKDLVTGQVTIATASAAGELGNGSSLSFTKPSFSADGTKLAFASYSSNLVAGDTNGTEDIFLKDLVTGAITRISTGAGGAQAAGHSGNPVFSSDGTKIAFFSTADGLVADDSNGVADVFVKNLITGEVTLVSRAANGAVGNGASSSIAFSPDGTKVAFYSESTNLAAGPTGVGDIYVKNLIDGSITLVTRPLTGAAANNYSVDPTFSDDGTQLAFWSQASNLAGSDGNGSADVFLVDIASGVSTIISRTPGGGAGNDGSGYPDIFGSKVVFASAATNLAGGSDGVFLATITGVGDTLYGGYGDDTLTGLGGADVIYGGAGADKLYGGQGDDTLNGGDDGDILDGGAGADTMAGGWGDDTYVVNDAGDAIYEQMIYEDEPAGYDTVYVWLNVWSAPQGVDAIVYNGPGAATLTGNVERNTITGAAGADTLDGGNNNDTLYGGSGGDTLYGGHGADAVYGGEGADALYGGYLNDSLYGGEGDDVIDAVDMNNLPYGYFYYDTSHGYIDEFGAWSDTNRYSHSGSDTVYGGAGNDVLKGDGNDTLYGGDGNDTYELRYGEYDTTGQGVSYAAYVGVVSEAAGGGVDTVRVYVPSDTVYVLGANIENGLAGSGAMDGNGLDNLISAIAGTTAKLTLRGLGGADTLTGGGGDDTLEGGAGADALYGGAGTDTAVFSGARAAYTVALVGGLLQVSGPDGTDTLQGIEKLKFSDMTIDTSGGPITGTDGPDTLTGTPGDDTIYGLGGNDTLQGLGGADHIYGGGDNDLIYGGDGADVISNYFGGTIYGGAGNDDIQGGTNIYGDDGNDHIVAQGAHAYYGGDGDDYLYDIEGGPEMYGGAGNDTLDASYSGSGLLYGGDGNDAILHFSEGYGGAGNDTFQNPLSPQATATGGAGDDAFYGDDYFSQETYYGDEGNDLFWVGGWDTAYGGAGDDVVHASSSYGDAYLGLYGGDGYDIVELTYDGGDVTANVPMDGFEEFHIAGGWAGETLTGGAFDDALDGRDGDDTLYGLGGDDVLFGGAGNDFAYGGAGDDDIQQSANSYGGDGDDAIAFTGANGGEFRGGAGNDSIDVAAGYLAGDLFGDEGDDTLVLHGAFGRLFGGDGQDFMFSDFYAADWEGGDMEAEFYGGAGDDLMYGGAYDPAQFPGGTDGVHIMDGGTGSDTVSYRVARSGVSVNLALTTNQTVGTGMAAQFFSIENLTGSAYNDTLVGDGADNVLEGGAGNDVLNGAAGLDTASYASAAAGVSVSLLLATAQNTVGAGTDTLSNIENLLGSAFNDTLTGNAAANLIEGGAGNDAIDGGAGIDTVSYIHATSGVTVNLGLTTAQAVGGGQGTDTLKNLENLTGSLFGDELIGSTLANTLSGLAGNDILRGGLGNDILDGGAGIDTASYVDATSKVTVSLLLGAQSTGGGGTDTLISIENLTGSNFDDTLAGNYGDNVINGGAGSDTVSYLGITPSYPNWLVVRLALTGPQNTGAAGWDTLIGIENVIGTTQGDTLGGDSGNNIIDGAAGDDTATYIDATAGVTVSLAITTAQNTVGAGTDTLKAIENLEGSSFADTLTGNTGVNRLVGGLGDDKLYGGAGNDQLEGGAGADLLDGGAGNDFFWVTDWLDTIVEAAGGGTDAVKTALNGYALAANVENLYSMTDAGLTGSGNALANGFWGGAGGDVFYGLAGDDKFYGNFGQDTFYGGDGNDSFWGESDDDVMYGGLGNDVYWVDDAGDVAIEAAGEGTDTVNTSLSAYTLADNIETLTVNRPLWMPGSRDFTGTGNAIANTLNGADGNDSLSGLAGDDKLFGGTGNDSLYGGDGNDILDGGAGIDSFYGGLGNDTFMVADAGETVTEALNGGTDTVKTALAAYTLADNVENLTYTGTGAFAGTGNALANVIVGGVAGDSLSGLGGDDKLTGGAAADSLAGGDGNDTLDGGLGADSLDGGIGNDTYVVDDLGDVVTEALNAGTDTVRTTLAVYALTDNVEALTYIGTAAFTGTGNALANTLTGGALNDVLYGGDGADRLAGGVGDDVLAGGGGGDTLTGGAGADAFVFTAAGDSLTATPDTVSDFSAAQGDYLDLSAIDADSLTAGDQAFTFLGTGAFTKHAGELRYQVSGVTTTVYGDINGDGVADFAIRLSNTTSLTGADFHP